MNDSIDWPKTLIYDINIGHILKIECKKQKKKMPFDSYISEVHYTKFIISHSNMNLGNFGIWICWILKCIMNRILTAFRN